MQHTPNSIYKNKVSFDEFKVNSYTAPHEFCRHNTLYTKFDSQATLQLLIIHTFHNTGRKKMVLWHFGEVQGQKYYCGMYA